jgi:hypothetical protein
MLGLFRIVIFLQSESGMKEQGHGKKRQKGGGKIGRIYFMHPSVGERYYLRMLLLIVKGAHSYESLWTYNNITYATFKEACNAPCLLNNDQEWYNVFDKATS